MDTKQDFFISHASKDKVTYVQPLAECLTKRKVTFWLDSYDTRWGDSLALKINEGLRESRHIVLCLSEGFLSRPWPEAELGAAFGITTDDGRRKVLPLILNDRERILAQYPLIAGLVYREYDNPEGVAGDLAALVNNQSVPDGHIRVVVESVHTGRLSNLVVSPRASIEWLIDNAKRGIGLLDSLDTGGFQRFAIRWVLVDVRAERDWQALGRIERQKCYAVVRADDRIQCAVDPRQRLEDIGVRNDIVLHLYAVEDTEKNDDRGGVCYSIIR